MTEEKFKEIQAIKDEISLVKTELRKLEKLFNCCSLQLVVTGLNRMITFKDTILFDLNFSNEDIKCLLDNKKQELNSKLSRLEKEFQKL